MSHCHIYIQSLRQRGYRVTPQREMIIEALADSAGHVTAEEIFAQVRKRTRAINLATIYRTLDLLVETGFASRLDLRDGYAVYATAQHGPHLHLVCKACGRVIDADHSLATPIDELLREQYGFSPDLQHLSILGLCADCLGSSAAGSSAAGSSAEGKSEEGE
ncbi:MAG TPA: Fur family transcriptional regulator [Anaerolineales bacterium]|nr:Fur family transcriptional regulator [Anaerolineales bacterium]